MLTYKLYHLSDLTEERITRYFSMLSPRKQEAVGRLSSPEERARTLLLEIAARDALFELSGEPRESFSVLLQPQKQSCVQGNRYKIDCTVCGEYVLCAVSNREVSCAMLPIQAFTFSEAQKQCTDSELRWILADSDISFAEFVCSKTCTDPGVCQRYHSLMCVKKACGQMIYKTNSAKAKNTGLVFENGEPKWRNDSILILARAVTPDRQTVFCAVENNSDF